MSSCCFGIASCFASTWYRCQVELRVLELRLIARHLPLGLGELHLERTGIDLREQVALLDELAFAERDPDELAVDAAPDGDGVHRGHRTEARQVNVEVPDPRRSSVTGICRFAIWA